MQKEIEEECIKFGEEFEEEIIDNEFIEKFRDSENVLTLIQCEEKLRSGDFKTIEEYLEYENNRRNSEINCPHCGKKLYRNFHIGKCPICENKLSVGHMVNFD